MLPGPVLRSGVLVTGGYGMSETSSQVSTPPSGAAPPEAPEAPEAPETGYRAAFLEILNGSARRHGFMVVAQETQSLQSLQGLCVDPEQEKTCLTARYRLGTGPVLGTLFAAFATDLQRLFRQDTRAKTDRPSPVAADDLLGDVLPPPAPDPLSTPWRLLQEPVQNLWSQIQPSEVGRWS